jgi:hypothetical protein
MCALLLTAAGEARDFEIVPRSVSPNQSVALATRPDTDIHEIVFFDVARKSPTSEDLSPEGVLRFIGLAQRLEGDKPNYEVAWSSDSRRVAFYAGFHQFASVVAYELRGARPIQLTIPDLQPQWAKIEHRIRPFRITKRWRAAPRWSKPNRLHIDLEGSAFQNDGKRERDLIDFTFKVTIHFDGEGRGVVTALESTK